MGQLSAVGKKNNRSIEYFSDDVTAKKKTFVSPLPFLNHVW